MIGFIEKLRKKGLQKAIKRCERALQQDPQDFKTRLRLADLYVRVGQKERAVEEYLLLADLFEAEDIHAKAVAVYKKVLALDPHLSQAHYALADLYAKRGLFGEAKKHLKKLLELSPEDEQAQRKLEQVEMEERLRSKPSESKEEEFFWQEVMQELESQLDLQVAEDDYQTHYQLGLAFKEMGLLEKAVEEFLKATGDPDLDFDAYLMLGICHREMGEYSKGVEFLKKALGRKGLPKERYREAYHQLGLCYQYLGKKTEAERAFAKAQKG